MPQISKPSLSLYLKPLIRELQCAAVFGHGTHHIVRHAGWHTCFHIESHNIIRFLAYCLQVTLKARLRKCAAGLTPRAVLEKFATVQMLDVHLPTTAEREINLSRFTQPEKDLQLLLDQMKLTLPEQGPPKITAPPSSGPSQPSV